RIIPCYLDVGDQSWVEVAERLLALYRGQDGRTRGELEQDLKDAAGNDPSQLVHQGLAKLLEDRCEFEVVSGHPPERLRELVFNAAAEQRRLASARPIEPNVAAEAAAASLLTAARAPFDRQAVLQEVASELGLTSEAVAQGLFADLKSEERLVRFKDITAP